VIGRQTQPALEAEVLKRNAALPKNLLQSLGKCPPAHYHIVHFDMTVKDQGDVQSAQMGCYPGPDDGLFQCYSNLIETKTPCTL